jgi:DNA-binding GntR family transcriptional regulator
MSSSPRQPSDSESASVVKILNRSKPVLRDVAYQKVIDELLLGRIKPGLLLTQRELCEATDSSIGAIREALKRLEAEGIISLIPQRGVIVVEPSVKELTDLYEFRKIIEPHAVRVYAESGDLQKIEDIKCQTQSILDCKATTREEIPELSRQRVQVDDLFHETLLRELGNDAVNQVFQKFRLQSQISRIAVQPRFHDSRPAAHEHLLIIDALEQRDAEAAAKAMLSHLERSLLRAIGLE